MGVAGRGHRPTGTQDEFTGCPGTCQQREAAAAPRAPLVRKDLLLEMPPGSQLRRTDFRAEAQPEQRRWSGVSAALSLGRVGAGGGASALGDGGSSALNVGPATSLSSGSPLVLGLCYGERGAWTGGGGQPPERQLTVVRATRSRYLGCPRRL